MANEATHGDRLAIEQVVRDYYESWFEGDAARMQRVLHRDLHKLSPDRDKQGVDTLKLLTAEMMVQWTADGVGRTRLPASGDPETQIKVEDVYDAIANVTVHSTVYREYVQLVRTREGWKILNVLWQRV
jgi:hypothetical protein